MARSLVTAYRGDRVREMTPVITTMRHFAEVRVLLWNENNHKRTSFASVLSSLRGGRELFVSCWHCPNK